MGIDPDKKVAKIQKERAGVYQSNKQPVHYDNEGEEYLEERREIKKSADEIQDNEEAQKSMGAR